MPDERRSCLSSLEQERCRVIPAIPEIFNVHSTLIESEHRQSLDRILHNSPPTTPLSSSSLCSNHRHNSDDALLNHTVTSVLPSLSTTSIHSRTNVAQLEDLLPKNDNPRACSEGPFRFIAIPNDISATNISTQPQFTSISLSSTSALDPPLSLSSSSSYTDSESLQSHPSQHSFDPTIDGEPAITTTSGHANASIINNNDLKQSSHSYRRKDSCSCYGLSRDSAPLLQGPISSAVLSKGFPHLSNSLHAIDIVSSTNPTNQDGPSALFPPLRIGILVGGETTSSGLHNITVGLYHFLKKFCKPPLPVRLPGIQYQSPSTASCPNSLPSVRLYGFPDGPIGLLKGDVVLLGDDAANVALYLNRGGCEALSYRSLRSLAVHSSQLERAVDVLSRIGLDGLVIYADREDLLAVAKLAETVEGRQCRTRIIAVPHSVGGDIFLPEYLPTTLGFDTARRTFTELTGNIATDSVSSKKYYHFLRCGSSILTLESALQTRPTISIIAEEAHQMNLRLKTIVEKVADIVTLRANALGKRSGTVLLSDKLIETLPELQVLLDELTYRLACPVYFPPNPIDPLDPQPPPGLSQESESLFRLLPKSIRLCLLTRKDHDGRPALPPIYSEVLVAHLVDRELRRRNTFNASSDIGFLYRTHDMNHECHCAMPTDFDCCLGYSLAHVAGALIAGGHNGYVACLQNLDKPVKEWKPSGVPLMSFLGVTEETKQQDGNSPSISLSEIIKKHRICVPRRTIDLSSFAVQCYQKYRLSWKISCLYRNPGPVQFVPGVVDVHPEDLPFVLRAHYIPGEEFDSLVQSPSEAKHIAKLEKLSSDQLVKLQRELLGVPDSEVIRKGRRRSITRKTKEQLTSLQLQRLQYLPKLPDLYHKVYTLEASDVTARLATNLSLLRAVFPLTHNLRALEIVEIGLRLRQTGQWRFDSTSSKNCTTVTPPQLPPSTAPPVTDQAIDRPTGLQRTVSSISLCGFIGSSSVVRLPIESSSSFGCLPTATSYPPRLLPPDEHRIDALLTPESVSNGKTPKGSPTSRIDRGISVDSQSIKRSHLPAPIPSRLRTLRRTGSIPSSMTAPRPSHFSSIDLDNGVPWHHASRRITSPPDVIRVIQEQEPVKASDPQKLDQLVSQTGNASSSSSPSSAAAALQQIKVAVCFLGRPAPGAMNVVWGLTTYLAQLSPPGICYGVVGGLEGLLIGNLIEITSELLEVYRNIGGIELLCRTSEHCHNEDDINACLATVTRFDLHGLVMCGGFATVSTSAILAETFLQRGCHTSITAVPVSIESGLPSIETTLGHDTSVRVFNSVIGSIMAECRSSKSWYFLRVSGRNLSHLCVECALFTHPTLVLISEEVEEKNMSLVSITNLISDVVEARASKGMMYGVVLLSDSLLDHVPEIRMLFDEINSVFQFSFDDGNGHHTRSRDAGVETSHSKRLGRHWPRSDEGLSLLRSRLTPWSAALFSSLPHKIQWQFAFSKDYTDKVDLGNIDTEVLLKTLVQTELSRRKSLGSFRQKGASFNCKTHFLAYQGRSALPTTFDCDLGFSLGYSAAVLIDGGKSGYLATMSNLHLPVEQWMAEAVPLTSLIDIKPVQQPPRNHHPQSLSKQSNGSDLHFSLHVPELRCSLESEPYQLIQANKLSWMFSDCFCSPGPVQFNDSTRMQRLCSLRSSPNPLNPTSQLKEISRLCSEIKTVAGSNAYSSVTAAAATSLRGLLDVLKTLAASGTASKTAICAGNLEKISKEIYKTQLTHQDLAGLSFLERYLATSIYPDWNATTTTHYNSNDSDSMAFLSNGHNSLD